MSRQIIAQDNDLNIISKIVELLAQGENVKRSRTFLEITDANGRAFRYVSMKDRPNESNGKVEQSRVDEAFHDLVERMSDKGRPRTSLHTYLENDEDDEEEESEEEQGSNQED